MPSTPFPTPAASAKMAEEHLPRVVYRVEVSWQQSFLDIVTVVPGQSSRKQLRTGDVLEIWAPVPGATSLSVRSGGEHAELVPEQPTPLGNGLTLVARCQDACPRAKVPFFFDTSALHAVILAGAVQLCVISALAMSPLPKPDREAGGGFPVGKWRRYLQVASGSAPQVGPAVVSATGRRLDLAERVLEAPPAERGERSVASSRPVLHQTLQEAVAALSQVVNNGTIRGDLARTVGDMAQSTASSPQLGAQIGGMRPFAKAAPVGAQSGEVGVGTAAVTRAIDDDTARRRTVRPRLRVQTQMRPIGPVGRVMHQDGQVELEDSPPIATLDPVVRDQIARAIRSNRRSIRYCYETFGLTVNAQQTGRLTLEVTLNTNGHLSDAAVTVSESRLHGVAECVERMAANWYLGDGLVAGPTRLAFPFILQPRVR